MVRAIVASAGRI